MFLVSVVGFVETVGLTASISGFLVLGSGLGLHFRVVVRPSFILCSEFATRGLQGGFLGVRKTCESAAKRQRKLLGHISWVTSERDQILQIQSFIVRTQDSESSTKGAAVDEFSGISRPPSV